jgi:hypothetical protein
MIDFETHKVFGIATKEFREKLIVEMCGKTKKTIKKEQKALKLLENMRSILDDIVFRDFKEKADKEKLKVYYGKDE